MKKPVKIALAALLCLVTLALVAVGGINLYFRLCLPDFYRRAVDEGPIPGLAEGFVPQGLSRVPEEELFLTCGYEKDGGASRIYLCYDAGPRYAWLAHDAGTADTTHAGGLAYWDGYVFLAHDDQVAVYDWEAVKTAAARRGSVAPAAGFAVGFEPAFCHVAGNILYVGEFYRQGVYPTPESHHMTTPGGEVHHAVLCAYDLAQLRDAGFSAATPLWVYSIPDLAQGACVTDDGGICISTSWGASFSHIRVYDDPASAPADGALEMGNAAVPLYYLDAARQREDIALIPMCEELYFMDGRVFFTNESASSKYVFGKFTGGGKLFSIPLAPARASPQG